MLGLLWYRSAATALIQPLAWELTNAAGVALKKQTKQSKDVTEPRIKPLMQQ